MIKEISQSEWWTAGVEPRTSRIQSQRSVPLARCSRKWPSAAEHWLYSRLVINMEMQGARERDKNDIRRLILCTSLFETEKPVKLVFLDNFNMWMWQYYIAQGLTTEEKCFRKLKKKTWNLITFGILSSFINSRKPLKSPLSEVVDSFTLQGRD